MNILIIGAGGREHAIAKSLIKNERVEKVFLSGNNGGAEGDIICHIMNPLDFVALDNFINANNIELTIVGPEDPLNQGIVDFLESRNHLVFGPRKSAARLEGSKEFAKEFMNKYGINTAKHFACHSYDEAVEALENYGYPVVIKADGLCQGKGVYICKDQIEAMIALKEIFIDDKFSGQGSSVVIEEYLQGFEASLLCFVSGHKIYPFDTAMDYKKIYEGDLGPNTGGVGAISPNPYWKQIHQKQSDEILVKIENGLEKEGLEFNGILFIGYMIHHDQVYVLEFNTRFGDPETEVLLPRLTSDLLENIEQCINGQDVKLNFADNVAMTTILVSDGYPNKYDKAFEISGLDKLVGVELYHNGTSKNNGKVYTNGGRVLSIVGLSPSLEESRALVYRELYKIKFDNMNYRRDIGKIK